MADYGHCGVEVTASERHVEGRHPTAVGVGLPCDRSRRPTAPIMHEPTGENPRWRLKAFDILKTAHNSYKPGDWPGVSTGGRKPPGYEGSASRAPRSRPPYDIDYGRERSGPSDAGRGLRSRDGASLATP